MFKYGYYVWLSAYTKIRSVSRIIMRFKLKLNKNRSNDVLSYMFSKIRAVAMESFVLLQKSL